MIPEAAFDTLAIVNRLNPSLGDLHPSEVHLFAYLSCLLSLYNGKPVADWGYTFAGTAEGSPFSPVLAESLDMLTTTGDLEQDLKGIRSTRGGKDEYDLLRQLSQNVGRELYILGACSSVLALPVGLVRAAMTNEPALHRASALGTARRLLERVDLDQIYHQFEALEKVLGNSTRDFMSPAVAWLMYLIKTTPDPVQPRGERAEEDLG